MAGHRNDAMTDTQTYYHGTKADLNVGDLIVPGHASNFGKRRQALFVYPPSASRQKLGVETKLRTAVEIGSGCSSLF
jgi:hypothetical protein